jgi:hypothetical protein
MGPCAGSAIAPLGRDDVGRERAFAISRRVFARALQNRSPCPPKRGSRECRVRAAPAVSCAKCANKGAHEHTGERRTLRHPLRNGFTAYIALSPVSGLVVTVTSRIALQGLAPASRRQDHTTSPYADSASSGAKHTPDAARVHRIPSQRVVTMATAPPRG